MNPGARDGIAARNSKGSPGSIHDASSVPRSVSGSPRVHMSQSNTATQRPGSAGSTAMLSRRQSLCTRVGGGDRIRGRVLLGLGALPAVLPALHLPREEPLGSAEVVEAAGARIDGMEGGERVDDHLGELAVLRGIAAAPELGRHLPAHHDPVATLHHEERRADHPHILAEQVGARRLRKGLPELRERAVFPRHVVGAGGEIAVRRTAEHVARGRIAQQVGEVGVAAGELPDLRHAAGAGEFPLEDAADGRRVDLLPGADGDGIGVRSGLLGHRRGAYTGALAIATRRRYEGDAMDLAGEFDPQLLFDHPDPYPLFAALRATQPVARVRMLGRESVIVSKYDDCLAVLKDAETFSSASNVEVGKIMGRTLIEMDGKEHTRHRLLVQQVFAAKNLDALDPVLRALANELLDALAPGGHADLVASFTARFPVQVIAHLVGIPRADHPQFQRWALDIIGFARDRSAGSPPLP